MYTFPALSKIVNLTYKRIYFWIDKYLYFNSLSKEKIEGYPADDDNYCCLSRFNPYTMELEVIVKWNDCNQYEAKSYQNNEIELENKYVASKADWKDRNKWKTRTLKIIVNECSFKKAYINDDLVRFRKEPGLSSEKISNLMKNDQITILSRTKERYDVNGARNYWYQVQDSTGIIGYVFGDYINIKK